MTTVELPVSPVVTLVAQRVSILVQREKELFEDIEDAQAELTAATAEREALTRWLAEHHE